MIKEDKDLSKKDYQMLLAFSNLYDNINIKLDEIIYECQETQRKIGEINPEKKIKYQ